MTAYDIAHVDVHDREGCESYQQTFARPSRGLGLPPESAPHEGVE